MPNPPPGFRPQSPGAPARPRQSSHKAWAASATVLGFWLIARYTGMVAAPLEAEVATALMVVLEGLIGGALTFAATWWTRNRPRDDGTNAGAPEGGRFRSAIGAGVVALLATLMLGGCWLTGRVDDATGTTLTQRCAFYAGVIGGIEAARAADGFITSDQAVRLALYRGLRDQYCRQVEGGGPAL